jgi:hypothetical protein
MINLLVEYEAGRIGCQAKSVAPGSSAWSTEVVPDTTSGLPESEIVDGLDGPVAILAMQARAKYLR